jgi:hypothetical protein
MLLFKAHAMSGGGSLQTVFVNFLTVVLYLFGKMWFNLHSMSKQSLQLQLFLAL